MIVTVVRLALPGGIAKGFLTTEPRRHFQLGCQARLYVFNVAALKPQLYDLAARIDGYRKSFDASKDSRAILAYSYVLITRQLGEAIETAGFSDPAWIVLLAKAFAAKYIAAIEAANRGSGLAPAWAAVFETIRNKRSTVLEDLLFAITAHIVHDLPFALIEVGLKDVNNVSRWPLKELNRYSISNIIIASIERTPEAKGSRQ